MLKYSASHTDNSINGKSEKTVRSDETVVCCGEPLLALLGDRTAAHLLKNLAHVLDIGAASAQRCAVA